MEPSAEKSGRSSHSPYSTVPDYSFYEYQWDGPKRLHPSTRRPRQTTLVVVFEGESRLLFSTARIVLYYGGELLPDAQSDAWDIQQSGLVIHSLRGVEDPSPNPLVLPKLTVAFEVVADPMTRTHGSSLETLVLRDPVDIEEVCRDSMHVLLEFEYSLTSDTLSLSLSFTHSTVLWTPLGFGNTEKHRILTYPTFWAEHITTRIVRVLPPVSIRPRTASGSLPTELLLKIFEDGELEDSWRDDLLTFVQVCRAWSCAMDVLHARLGFSDDEEWNFSRSGALSVYALANALSKNPGLGRSFRHFTMNHFGTYEEWEGVFSPQPEKAARFAAAVIAILHHTKDIQCLHLGELNTCQADVLFEALHALRDIHTFSIGHVVGRPIRGFLKHNRARGATYMLSVFQLARLMKGWRALRVLNLRYFYPSVSGVWRFALPAPACALTQLTINRSHMTDKDLRHLFATSAKTLERVVLINIAGVTNAGLTAFLLSISQNVVHLTIQDVFLASPLVTRRKERALDATIDKMLVLRELRISGDVVSESMLERRSKMFIARNATAETRVPIVQLWSPFLLSSGGTVLDGRWPGWCVYEIGGE